MISGLRVKRADGTWTDSGGADLEGFWPPPTTKTDYSIMFYFWDWITTVPPLDTSNVTNMTNMFNGCSSLTSIPLLDTSNVTNMGAMFSGCSSLMTVPPLDTSNVTNMTNMFTNCPSLTTVPPLDASSVTDANAMFSGCSSLTSVVLNGLGVSLSVADTNMDADALNALFDGLATVTAQRTVDITNTPGAATCDRTIATNKGWTVTG